MASISSLSGGSSSSSIYGNRNIISGLASGLDTEAMIENAVSGYQLKITSLQQSKTRVEWKQEAYRSMITKLVGFSQKYTSYTSGTNLLSNSFFDNSTKVTSLGSNASKVSASGRTNSNVQINSVTRLAAAAKYTVSAKDKLGVNNVAGAAVELKDVNGANSKMEVGTLKGTMTLTYGNKNVLISFSESDAFDSAEKMAEAINEKLKDEKIAFDGGSQVAASERIKAVVSADKKSISFEMVKGTDSNTIKISRVSGNLGEKLNLSELDDDDKETSFAFEADKVKESKDVIDVLSEKGFTITLNGQTKTIKGPTADELGANWDANSYAAALQEKINEEFGGKFTVKNVSGDSSKLQLSFETGDDTDSFKVSTTMAEKLGMEGGLSNKLNLSRKLEDVFSGSWEKEWAAKVDDEGNIVKNSDGKEEYIFRINDKSSVTVTKDMTLQQLMDKLNGDENSDVKISYSSFSDKITFTSKDTGANEKIQFSGLSEQLFGTTTDVHGEDAEFSVTVDGGAAQTVTRSTNTVDIDGLQVTLKGTFETTDKDYEPVTFSVSSDADKIVDAVKSMVADYNAMMTEIKEAYSTIPLKNSKGGDYMPLTDEDLADMSESAVANYEKKAKTGLLFADRDLANLYSNMTDALKAFGISGNDGTGIGITTSFSNGTTTLVVDENALRKALEDNPNKVKEVFTGKNGNDGVMQKLKNQLDTYAGTTGATKGILINKAGSALAPTSIYQNTLQKEIDGLEEQIEKWQDKVSDKIDYYNKKFTSLETLIAQMNNQSSMLMGLSGGY